MHILMTFLFLENILKLLILNNFFQYNVEAKGS